jgi:NADH:ubiquinone oxidoreductase subunit C
MDASAISFKNIFLKYFKNKNKIIFFILEKNYFLNNYTFNLSYQSINKGKIKTISNNYLNSSWLEREVSEMYGLFFFNKPDSRKLLLDYTSEINPLKKNSNVGLLDYTFNISKNRLVKTKHNMVEL